MHNFPQQGSPLWSADICINLPRRHLGMFVVPFVFTPVFPSRSPGQKGLGVCVFLGGLCVQVRRAEDPSLHC